MNSKVSLENFYRNPVREEFEQHHGIIKILKVNPKEDSFFLSSAMDNSLRVYQMNEREPTLIMNFDKQITSASWVAINPNMIVVG